MRPFPQLAGTGFRGTGRVCCSPRKISGTQVRLYTDTCGMCSLDVPFVCDIRNKRKVAALARCRTVIIMSFCLVSSSD